jgi:uncharacterized protein
MNKFFRYTLRTSDVGAARAFYSAVLGDGDADVVQLHEQAVARGARPHWLGFIDVRNTGEVEAAASAFVARGASPLAPKWVNPEGLEAAVMRDPGGAIVALAKPPPAPVDTGSRVCGAEVVWHLLNTNDVDRAKSNYGELFGWEFKESQDLGSHGVFHPFAWERGEPAVGSMADVSARSGVHPHWLFHLHVAALDPALDAVRANGGTVVGPFVLPNGDRVGICDDPQGAAFGLYERATT